jgi:tetratricopeptide (TPR) repeat protein
LADHFPLWRNRAARLESAVPRRSSPTATASSARRNWIVVGLLLAGLLLGLGWIWRHGNAGRAPRPSAPAFALPDQASTYAAYGGSAGCRECHEEAFAAWLGSHHGQAERPITPLLDERAFVPPGAFTHGSQRTAYRTNAAGQYELVTTGLHGTNQAFIAERVLGYHPLRQMLVPFPGGRWQASEAAWDPRSNEWFNVYGDEDRKPGEWGHWTGRGMNWNSMCAACHNTRLRKNYDLATDTFRTAWIEHGVGCESCHGPMKNHNDWQRANKGKGLKDPTIRKFTRDEMFDTCAACHSRRAEITGDPKPGDSYWDHHLLSIVDESNLYYPDGQVWDEDFEVAAFLGSKMFHKGVRCVDCHDPHTMKNRLPGNFLCLSCHGPGQTNAPVINPVTHSRHKVFGYDTNGNLINLDLSTYNPKNVKETGGECVNCHMPQTVYMQRHWRHDHGFTIPDPLLTKQFGIPNACNRCHQDKDTDWSLRYVEEWYGDKMNRPYRTRAQTVALARQGDAAARDPLLKQLATDEIPYWQAVAANLLGRWATDPAVRAALLAKLDDPHPLVRQMAAQSLGPLTQAGDTNVAAALNRKLADPRRNVRIEAARHLAATLDTNTLAGAEYLHFLDHIADQPLGQMQRGVFQLQRGHLTNALSSFQRAVAWDPYSAGLRHELAIVLSQLGRAHEAVEQLEAAVRLQPTEAEFHFKLALALNEVGESARVVTALEAAVKQDPRHARAWYNLGLARSGRGDAPGALEALLRAEAADPRDPRAPYARATVLAQLGRLEEARAAARRALELAPDFTAARTLLWQLETR